MDNELVELVYRAPSEAIQSDQLSLRLVKDGDESLYKIITNRGAGANNYQLLSKSLQLLYEMLHLAEIGYDYDMPHWLCRLDHLLKHFHLEYELSVSSIKNTHRKPIKMKR